MYSKQQIFAFCSTMKPEHFNTLRQMLEEMTPAEQLLLRNETPPQYVPPHVVKFVHYHLDRLLNQSPK